MIGVIPQNLKSAPWRLIDYRLHSEDMKIPDVIIPYTIVQFPINWISASANLNYSFKRNFVGWTLTPLAKFASYDSALVQSLPCLERPKP